MPVHRRELIGHFETMGGMPFANYYTYVSSGEPEMQGYSAEWLYQDCGVVASDPFSLQTLVEKVAGQPCRSVLLCPGVPDQQDTPPWAKG